MTTAKRWVNLTEMQSGDDCTRFGNGPKGCRNGPDSGRVGSNTKILQAGTDRTARKLAHELWPTECLPGQLSEELPMPSHFAVAAEIVSEEMVVDAIASGPDPSPITSKLGSTRFTSTRSRRLLRLLRPRASPTIGCVNRWL
jgi:hypothetical protein